MDFTRWMESNDATNAKWVVGPGSLITSISSLTIIPTRTCNVAGTISLQGTLKGVTSSPGTDSQPAQIAINQAFPQDLTVTAPNGYSGSTACNTSPVKFTINIVSTDPSCISNYTWLLPNAGWTYNGQVGGTVITSSNTILLTPSGNLNDKALIQGRINLTCGLSTMYKSYQATFNAPLVLGTSPLCSSGQFSVNNLSSGVNTSSWSSSNTSIATVSSSGLVTKTGTGNVTISATLPCGVPVTPLNIWVGKPGADITTLIYVGTRGVNPVSTSPSSTYYFQVDAVPSATTYSWVVPWLGNPKKGGTSSTITGAANAIYLTTPSSTGTYTINCSANNDCGISYTNSLTINNTIGGGGGGGSQQMVALSTTSARLSLVVYPNPTSSMFSVYVTDSLASTQKNDKLDLPYELQLINKSQRSIFNIKSNEKSILIPTDGIPSDTYYLHLHYKNSIIKKQVIIQK